MASAWIARQETQQIAEEPGKPLAGAVFTWEGVNFQKGTARTPTDACTIQAFNGAAKWVIYWKNKELDPPTAGSWEQKNDSYADYLKAVIGQL